MYLIKNEMQISEHGFFKWKKQCQSVNIYSPEKKRKKEGRK